MKKLFFLGGLIGLMNLVSCSKDYEIQPSVGQIILSADSTSPFIGSEVTLTVLDDHGNDITQEVEFTVNDEPVSGNVIASDVTGTFQVKATYLGIQSNRVDVLYRDGSQILYRKRILIEDYTGTWCGYCPRVAWGIHLLGQQTDNYVAVAIHRASSNPTDAAFDPYNYDTMELENGLALPAGYPKGLINRTTRWRYPEPNRVAEVLELTNGDPKLGLAIDTERSGSNLNIEVRTRFAQEFSGLKLVVYVLENGMIYDQTNYTTYYDSQDPIPNFQHDHILRSCLTSLFGEEIPAAQTGVAETFTKSFSIPMPANVVNPDNVEVVAFIVGSDNAVINARKAAINSTQDFEEL